MYLSAVMDFDVIVSRRHAIHLALDPFAGHASTLAGEPQRHGNELVGRAFPSWAATSILAWLQVRSVELALGWPTCQIRDPANL